MIWIPATIWKNNFSDFFLYFSSLIYNVKTRFLPSDLQIAIQMARFIEFLRDAILKHRQMQHILSNDWRTHQLKQFNFLDEEIRAKNECIYYSFLFVSTLSSLWWLQFYLFIIWAILSDWLDRDVTPLVIYL